MNENRITFTKSLAVKTMFWIALSLLIVLGIFSHESIVTQDKRLLDQTENEIFQLCQGIKGSIECAMIHGQWNNIQALVEHISFDAGVEDLRGYDRQGEIVFAKMKEYVGRTIEKKTEKNCLLCHQSERSDMQQTAIFQAPDGHRILRISYPLYNESECEQCHAQEPDILGDLIIDVSLAGIDGYTAENRHKMVTSTVMALLSAIIVIYLLILSSVTNPIQKLIKNMAKMESGDLDVSVNVDRKDEIGILSISFNRMAAKLKDLYTSLEQKVAERTTELKASQDQLIQAAKLASVGELAAGVAHEINNPVGIILTRSDYLLSEAEEQNLPQDTVDDLKVIHEQSDRIAKIVKGLLTFSRKSPVQPQSVDINEIVDRAQSLAANRLKLMNIETVLTLSKQLPRVKIDPHQIEQVLINILNNAIDAMPHGGRLKIVTDTCVPEGSGEFVTEDQTEFIRIAVTDTGSGIPDDIRGKIFDPFFSTKSDQKGTGLGLAVSYGIIREHKGKIRVESKPGRGTTFEILLPVPDGG